ncbi:MAG: calcium-translocating P-type ATPase, PMCA-type [Clostridia bacterium]|jgi:Ca2+-transporting ATPase|nr:calcium-translocating P-type ATPase, PMCA-type [Clostridia bacterium]
MWHTQRKDEVLKNLGTNEKEGLVEEEVKKRQEKDGKNRLQEKKKDSFLIKFLKQFNDFMIIILIIASIVSAFVSKMQGENDYVDSIIIIGIVVFNALMGVIQEAKAEKAIESLKQMTPQIAKVIRNGKKIEINAEELVKGDIIELEAGNFVPADCRILESHNLKIEESSLTGETEPALKDADMICKKDITLGDMKNSAFMASITVNGHGRAVVTEIGMNTKVGQIANMIIEDTEPETPLQKKLGEVGKILGLACLVICIIIFVIGLIKHIEPVEMFMTSVGLAVAAIPEGLPAIVTIMLSIGVTKMAKKNSIIRKLPAVETLGSSSVICSDKTGTLTQNKMTVVDVKGKNKKFIIELASLCTDCEISVENGNKNVSGEPTEKAIVEEGINIGAIKSELEVLLPRINEIPFDSNRKMMTTIHKIGNKYRVITKGAPDVLLQKCTKEVLDINEMNNQYSIRVQALNISKIQNDNKQMAQNALRVIAVAYKDVDYLPTKIDSANIENNLTFVGLIGMIDPPRDGVKEAVRTCKEAGIKTVMITGDHLETARAIARDLGILESKDKAITGQELDKMTQEQLEKNIRDYSVFARVTPEHKVRIVKAWQRKDAVVAMTGDGVNDSPALKNADIGIAMGKNGTDVAKNAADIILTDDNFVTIVEAVKQGRNIYDNIKKAIHFLIATNIGEIVTIFVGLILGLKSPLLAIQLLWINLVTDSLPAIALGLEKPEKDIMNRKPVSRKKGIFADGLWNKIIVEGVMIGILTLVAFSVGNKYYGLEVGRTMAFLSIGLLELIHSFNIKSDKSIFGNNLFENKYLVGSFVLGVFIQAIVVVIPFLANIFEVVPLNLTQWIITACISMLPIPIVELQKRMDVKNGVSLRKNNKIYNCISKKV